MHAHFQEYCTFHLAGEPFFIAESPVIPLLSHRDLETVLLHTTGFRKIKIYPTGLVSSFMETIPYARAQYAQKNKIHRRQCKVSSTKKITCKLTLRQVLISLRPRTPYPPPPPPYTHCIRVYSIQNLVTQRRGGGVEPERRLEGNRGQYRSQSWVENTNMTESTQEIGYLPSINSDKHMPKSPCTGQFFQMTTFCIDFYKSYLSTTICSEIIL